LKGGSKRKIVFKKENDLGKRIQKEACRQFEVTGGRYGMEEETGSTKVGVGGDRYLSPN